MSKKFEKLIEYVINDEEQKARDLFHEIVVEKSREIYENLMAEEDMEETLGGRETEQLMKDVSVEEEGMMGEADEEGELVADFETEELPADDADMDMDADMGMDADMDDDMDDDMGGDEVADTVDSIDSKLDELLAKFEEVIGNDAGEEDEEDLEEAEDMDEDEDMDESVMEAVQLKKVATDGHSVKLAAAAGGGDRLSVNDKSTVAANAGAGVTGSVAKPASSKFTETNPDGTAAPKTEKAKELVSGGFQNEAGKDSKGLKPATKPHLAQASGVNTKSTLKPLAK